MDIDCFNEAAALKPRKPGVKYDGGWKHGELQ